MSTSSSSGIAFHNGGRVEEDEELEASCGGSSLLLPVPLADRVSASIRARLRGDFAPTSDLREVFRSGAIVAGTEWTEAGATSCDLLDKVVRGRWTAVLGTEW